MRHDTRLFDHLPTIMMTNENWSSQPESGEWAMIHNSLAPAHGQYCMNTCCVDWKETTELLTKVAYQTFHHLVSKKIDSSCQHGEPF